MTIPTGAGPVVPSSGGRPRRGGRRAVRDQRLDRTTFALQWTFGVLVATVTVLVGIVVVPTAATLAGITWSRCE